MDQSEINVLYSKAKRFLSKDNVQKEKAKIVTEIKNTYIAVGPSKSNKP